MLLVFDDIYNNDQSNKSFIKDFFNNQTLHLSRPMTYKGLTLVGISSPSKTDGQRYLTLSEGIRSGSVKIAEVSESGNVPKLSIQNHSNYVGRSLVPFWTGFAVDLSLRVI